MRPDHLPDAALTAEHVPPDDAAWADVVEFGHRYHAYRVAGSLQRVADLTLQAHHRWEQEGELPDSLPRLRLALFHTVRATQDAEPDRETVRWARALVAAIRGHVTGAPTDR